MKRILIAEDDFYIRDIYSRIFVNAGYDTHTAVDGQDAIAKIQNDAMYDMVLLDILMPKMNGIDVLKAIRALEPPKKNTPVYIISNLGQENVIEDAFKIGLDGYVIKAQVTPQRVVDEINLFLKKNAKNQE